MSYFHGNRHYPKQEAYILSVVDAVIEIERRSVWLYSAFDLIWTNEYNVFLIITNLFWLMYKYVGPSWAPCWPHEHCYQGLLRQLDSILWVTMNYPLRGCHIVVNGSHLDCLNSLRPSDAYMRQQSKIIVSDNGLSPVRRQAFIWTNDGILLIQTLGANFSEILIRIQTFTLRKMHLRCRLWNCVHCVSASMC